MCFLVYSMRLSFVCVRVMCASYMLDIMLPVSRTNARLLHAIKIYVIHHY